MLLKKSAVLLAAVALSIGLFAEETDAKGAHPYKVDENENATTEFAHWSLAPHIGFNYFDGDFHSEMKHGVAIPNAGLDLEYSFTPVWGIGVSYMYDMYTITGDKSNPQNADTLLNGHMHKAGLYLSMDLVNLFYPRAQKKIFSANAILGGGYAWYKSTTIYHDDCWVDEKGVVQNPTHKRGNTANYVNADGNVAPDYMTSYDGQFYLQAGLGVEFNLNRTLALGVRATYNYFINDKIDGRGYSYNPNGVASKNNDGIVDVTLNMRFKLEGVKKTHMRNISHDNTLDDMLKRSVKKDTVVMVIRDTVVMKPETISIAATPSTSTNTSKSEYHSHTSSTITGQTFYVYFDNARSELTEQGLTIVQQVADRMLNDSNLYVDVVGMCDNTGSDEINNRLARARAVSVLDELRDEYGIANSHCLTSGRGKIVGRKSKAAYGPNRRVEIRLISKQEYDRLKAEREQRGDVTDASKEKPAAPTTTTQTTVEESSSNTTTTSVTITEEDNEQAARQTVLNDPTGRTVRQKESVNAVTLTSLARKHYGNANCWVFIYEANKEKIVDINTMPVGVDITIPQLTDEQKRISKEDALVYYYRIK